MKEHGVGEAAFISVADSALVTEENLARARRFITRLPATYNECERVLLDAIDADQWTEVGRIARDAPSKNRPGATYRVHEGSVDLYGKPYWAIVVHSSAHDKRRQKPLERELAASLKAITAQAKACEKKTLFCRADAEASAKEAMAQPTAYHRRQVRVVERPRYARGRPKRNAVQDLGPPATHDALAYDQFLRGRQHFYQFFNREENRTARGYFAKTIDPIQLLLSFGTGIVRARSVSGGNRGLP